MIEVYKKFFLMLGVTVLLCLSVSVVWSETMDNLVERDGLYYKKFSYVPFTGKVEGKHQGFIMNGKIEGSWVTYYENGQVESKGNFKNGKREGFWVYYRDNGKLFFKGNYKNNLREGSWEGYNGDGSIQYFYTGTYKDGKKISN